MFEPIQNKGPAFKNGNLKKRGPSNKRKVSVYNLYTISRRVELNFMFFSVPGGRKVHFLDHTYSFTQLVTQIKVVMLYNTMDPEKTSKGVTCYKKCTLFVVHSIASTF